MEDMELNNIDLEEKVTPLSFAQRLKRSMVMKRYAGKIAAARMRAQTRRASPAKLKDRSHRKALMLLRTRLSRAKGYGQMSPSEKLTLDKRLSGIPQEVINRIALKQIPVVRKAEMQRMASMNRPKNEDIDTDKKFEVFLENFTQESSKNKNYYAGLSKSTVEKRKTHFKKGFTPVNKGKKMSNELKDKVKHTFFKKGNMPHNSYSQESGVITIRTDKRGNDYQFIKLAHGVWEPLHRHVWQQANGAIPKDYIIIFKDFNTMNCQLQNLDCITKSDNMKRNTIHNLPEEIKANIDLTRLLNRKIKKLTNNNQTNESKSNPSTNTYGAIKKA